MNGGEGKVELFAKSSEEACVREILGSVGLGDELEEFDFFPQICHRGGP